MSSPTAVAERPSRRTRLEDALWADLPGWVWQRSPTLGLTLSDGGWLRARPRFALAVPVVAFALGLARGAWRSDDQLTYGYSAIWLTIFVAIALIGCAVGMWLLAGFVVGDLLGFQYPAPREARLFEDVSVLDWLIETTVPRLIGYAVLAMLLVGAPLLAVVLRGSVIGMLQSAPWRTRMGFSAVTATLAAGVYAALWTQAYPLLIRPVWTWHSRFGSAPDQNGIVPVQESTWQIGAAAGLSAAVVAVLSFVALRDIVGRRVQPIAQPHVRTRGPVRGTVVALATAAAVTLLLAGVIPGWWHAAITLGVLAAAFWAQARFIPRLPVARWWTSTVPTLLRVLTAVAAAWLVGWLIVRNTYEPSFAGTQVTTEQFDLLLWAIVAAITVSALLLPASPNGGDGDKRADGSPEPSPEASP